MDLRYAQYLSFISKDNQKAKEVLLTVGKLVDRVLDLSPQLQFMSKLLLGHVNVRLFYESMLAFQGKFMQNRKYQGTNGFVSHVPYESIALGHFMVELPGFSDKFASEFSLYLKAAEESL